MSVKHLVLGDSHIESECLLIREVEREPLNRILNLAAFQVY